MIKTKTELKREARNARISELFNTYQGKKSAVVEQIARECKTSVTTVNRIVSSIK